MLLVHAVALCSVQRWELYDERHFKVSDGGRIHHLRDAPSEGRSGTMSTDNDLADPALGLPVVRAATGSDCAPIHHFNFTLSGVALKGSSVSAPTDVIIGVADATLPVKSIQEEKMHFSAAWGVDPGGMSLRMTHDLHNIGFKREPRFQYKGLQVGIRVEVRNAYARWT